MKVTEIRGSMMGMDVLSLLRGIKKEIISLLKNMWVAGIWGGGYLLKEWFIKIICSLEKMFHSVRINLLLFLRII